jgi:hypothetical protein
MITIEVDSSKEGIEIIVDSEGVDELIRYLLYIKKMKDHYHLLVGNELSEEIISSKNTLVKHAKLVYWDAE